MARPEGRDRRDRDHEKEAPEFQERVVFINRRPPLTVLAALIGI